jgi:hypothetical protein
MHTFRENASLWRATNIVFTAREDGELTVAPNMEAKPTTEVAILQNLVINCQGVRWWRRELFWIWNLEFRYCCLPTLVGLEFVIWDLEFNL